VLHQPPDDVCEELLHGKIKPPELP
jgi:hypothetical protein